MRLDTYNEERKQWESSYTRTSHRIYDCEICGSFHPWEWDGDCREDGNRYASEEDYAKRNGVSVNAVEVSSMDERVEADRQ